MNEYIYLTLTSWWYCVRPTLCLHLPVYHVPVSTLTGLPTCLCLPHKYSIFELKWWYLDTSWWFIFDAFHKYILRLEGVSTDTFLWVIFWAQKWDMITIVVNIVVLSSLQKLTFHQQHILLLLDAKLVVDNLHYSCTSYWKYFQSYPFCSH